MDPPADRELPVWIRSQAEGMGFKITPGAAALLADLVDPSLGRLRSELEKLIAELRRDIASQGAELQYDASKASSNVIVGIVLGILIGVLFAIFIVRRITAPIETGVQSLSRVAEELSVVAEQTQKGSDRQGAQTGHVATAISEMNETVQTVATNANCAADSARQADENVRAGQSVVKDTIGSIDELAGEIETSADVIYELEKSIEVIGSVLDVIKGFTEKTNLLALNAAIEAARAGEHGRGFAVVANEVRTLASRTQESTTEIQEMISQLQSQGHAAVDAIKRGQEKAKTSVANASNAGDALNAIAQSVETITRMNRQIAMASDQQKLVAENINENVVHIRHVTDENASASDKLSSSSGVLSGVANDLRKMVSRG